MVPWVVAESDLEWPLNGHETVSLNAQNVLEMVVVDEWVGGLSMRGCAAGWTQSDWLHSVHVGQVECEVAALRPAAAGEPEEAAEAACWAEDDKGLRGRLVVGGTVDVAGGMDIGEAVELNGLEAGTDLSHPGIDWPHPGRRHRDQAESAKPGRTAGVRMTEGTG